MPCLIPLWLTIIAANPCAAWERFQVAYQVAAGRIYALNHIVEPAHDIEVFEPMPINISQPTDINHIGPLIYEEVEADFNGLAGSYEWKAFSIPHIKVSLASSLNPEWHEMQHAICYRLMGKGTRACGEFQHGTAGDPIVNNLTRMFRALTYPLTDVHSYMRGVLDKVIAPVNYVKCEVAVQ